MTEPAPTTPPNLAKLTHWQMVCLNALSLPIAMGSLVVVSFIPTFFAVEKGLGLSLVGAVFVIGRLLDVITDPLIGHFSDATESRFGPRIPWMVIGLPAYCLAVWMLLSLPQQIGIWYLAVASGLYFLFYTALDVPYSSVNLEISSYPHERTVITAYKGIFQVAGATLASFLPFIFALDTANNMIWSAKIVLGLCVLGLVLFLAFVPRRSHTHNKEGRGFFASLALLRKSRHYVKLIIAFAAVQTANSFSSALTVLYVTHVIGAQGYIGLFLGISIISAGLILPLWTELSKRIGKYATWQCSLLFGAGALALIPFLGQGDIIATSVLFVLVGCAFGGDAIMPTTILADIIAKDEKEGKSRIAGLYLAIKNAASKITFIAPMGLAFPVLDLIDFDTSTESINGALQINTLLAFYCLAPILLRISAFLIVRSINHSQSKNQRNEFGK